MNNVDIICNKEIVYIPVNDIKSNSFQTRKTFNRHSLEELAESIREFGVVQPICVRIKNYITYELVIGERRLRASKMAGLKEIPAIIVNLSDRDSAVISLVENCQRDNLDFMEESESMADFMDMFGYSQRELSNLISKRASDVDKKIRIERLDEDVKQAIKKNNLDEEFAVAICRIDNKEKQLKIIKKIVNEGININRAEEIIENIVNDSDVDINSIKSGRKIRYIFKDMSIFINSIKKSVDLMGQYGIKTDYNIKRNGNEYEINIKINP